MIPGHVAAYALGCRHATSNRATWLQIAHFVQDVGLGSYDPGELQAAAEVWAERNIGRGAAEEIGEEVARLLAQHLERIKRGRKVVPS